jgi:tRNA G10  N-methylase Trm11
MKYFFILGNNPTLSIAEISAVFGLNKTNEKETGFPIGNPVSTDVFILETDKPTNAPELIKKLGGTIKIGEIADTTAPSVGAEHCSVPTATNTDDYIKKIKKIIEEKLKREQPTGKFNYGISNHTDKNINTKIIGMELKTWLKEKNISSRFVVSKEKTLSSVVAEQNKLTKSGVEIVILPGNIMGYTLAVQPFKELSFRDYGRPGRDDMSGMLPPKLAQIMINLSGLNADSDARRGKSLAEAVLLDPFCGSGTVLTEAMLMGFQNLIGADVSPKAIEDTKKNIAWIKINYQLSIINYQLFNISTIRLSQKIPTNSVDVIVTEPYLGPQRGKIDFQKTIRELEQLYSETFKEFYKILKTDGRIVMIWPVIYNKYFLNPKIQGWKIICPLSQELKNNPQIKLTNRNTIIYGREGQKVWREIVILEK